MKHAELMKRTGALILIVSLLLGLAGCSIPLKGSEEAGADGSSAAGQESTAEQTQAPPSFSQQLEARWLNGDLDDLAGFYQPVSDPEEAARLQAIRDDFAAFEEESSATEEEKSLLNLTKPYTKLTLPEIPADTAFPLTAEVTIVTPDLAQILKTLGYENYEDADKLTADLEATLQKGGYPERTSTVTLTLQKDGEGVYAEPNREALFAFYGGLAELYMTEYTKYLEEIGQKLGGEEP